MTCFLLFSLASCTALVLHRVISYVLIYQHFLEIGQTNTLSSIDPCFFNHYYENNNDLSKDHEKMNTFQSFYINHTSSRSFSHWRHAPCQSPWSKKRRTRKLKLKSIWGICLRPPIKTGQRQYSPLVLTSHPALAPLCNATHQRGPCVGSGEEKTGMLKGYVNDQDPHSRLRVHPEFVTKITFITCLQERAGISCVWNYGGEAEYDQTPPNQGLFSVCVWIPRRIRSHRVQGRNVDCRILGIQKMHIISKYCSVPGPLQSRNSKQVRLLGRANPSTCYLLASQIVGWFLHVAWSL